MLVVLAPHADAMEGETPGHDPQQQPPIPGMKPCPGVGGGACKFQLKFDKKYFLSKFNKLGYCGHCYKGKLPGNQGKQKNTSEAVPHPAKQEGEVPLIGTQRKSNVSQPPSKAHLTVDSPKASPAAPATCTDAVPTASAESISDPPAPNQTEPAKAAPEKSSTLRSSRIPSGVRKKIREYMAERPSLTRSLDSNGDCKSCKRLNGGVCIVCKIANAVKRRRLSPGDEVLRRHRLASPYRDSPVLLKLLEEIRRAQD